MAFNIKGYQRGNMIGVHPTTGVPLYSHTYATPDAETAPTGANYFDALAQQGLVKKGEWITATVVIDGTPLWRTYMITAVTNSGLPTGTCTVAEVTGAGLT